MQTSVYTLDNHRQADGRIYVRETHTDNAGEIHTIEYLAPANWSDTEYTATMAVRAAQIDAELAESEFAQVINKEV